MFTLSTLFGCKSESNKTIKLASVSEFSEGLALDNVQLIDVRTAEEYQAGHIENAQLIDIKLEDFRDRIQELDKDKPVYLYCKSGGRSGKASKVLDSLGFKEIVDLKGGFTAWSKQ